LEILPRLKISRKLIFSRKFPRFYLVTPVFSTHLN
jgi:hypothetical protein